MAQTTSAQQLYDLLVSRNFDPELLDASGRPSSDPAETDVFSFDFTTESGNDYGTVVIMITDENSMEIYFGDNIGRGMEEADKQEWFDFLYQLRMFAKRNLMTFGLKNLNRLRYSMQGQAAIKEGLFESWAGKKDLSWNAGPTESRLMIRHKRALGEGEARFRYVESLFIETNEGERYKLPFKNLAGGKAMLEHVRQGGRPYDIRGQHITEMVSDINVLSRFRRANQGKLLEGDTAVLVEQTNAYYESIKHTMKGLATSKGYATYFESWQPTSITEESVVIEGLKHLFVTQSIDQRIEDALPLLARIQQGTNMKEATIFEAWADNLVEGTWSTPDTPEKQAQLVQLMSKEFPVGADATNATEQLYDLIGDDKLFDQLEDLAQIDANADARQVILDRMQELADNPDIAKVMAQFDADVDTPAEQEPMEEIKDPATQTEDPAGTEEEAYPEYAQDLDSMLKHAGVPAQERPAPDYEDEVTDEGILGTLGGAGLGMALGGPIGAAIGAVGGQEMTKGGSSLIEKDEEETDEGWKGQLAGGTVGTLAGTAAGAALGPVGAVVGGALGGTAGQMAGDALGGNEEETDEGKLGAIAGGAVGGYATKSVKGAVGGAKIGSALQDRFAKKKEAVKETTALQGQYGHSGQMQEFGKIENDIVSRLKQLSGLMKTDK
jgi:hypothetical protein